MSHRDNMSLCGKVAETDGRNVSEGTFCHNPGKSGHFATATLRPPLGQGGRKISRHFHLWIPKGTEDMVKHRMLHWVYI
jgi:hypothetical protein